MINRKKLDMWGGPRVKYVFVQKQHVEEHCALSQPRWTKNAFTFLSRGNVGLSLLWKAWGTRVLDWPIIIYDTIKMGILRHGGGFAYDVEDKLAISAVYYYGLSFFNWLNIRTAIDFKNEKIPILYLCFK
jgi:hypothetical protein